MYNINDNKLVFKFHVFLSFFYLSSIKICISIILNEINIKC